MWKGLSRALVPRQRLRTVLWSPGKKCPRLVLVRCAGGTKGAVFFLSVVDYYPVNEARRVLQLGNLSRIYVWPRRSGGAAVYRAGILRTIFWGLGSYADSAYECRGATWSDPITN